MRGPAVGGAAAGAARQDMAGQPSAAWLLPAGAYGSVRWRLAVTDLDRRRRSGSGTPYTGALGRYRITAGR
jgi:hypothetical protein